MLTAAKLTTIPDPAEVLAEMVTAANGASRPSGSWTESTQAAWWLDATRAVESQRHYAVAASTILHAAALIAAHYERGQ
jgi:hypothetical protein